MFGDRDQQVAKASERVTADRPLFVVADPNTFEPGPIEDIKMVEPEIDHDLQQLARAQHGPEQSRRRGLVDHGLRPPPLRLGLLR